MAGRLNLEHTTEELARFIRALRERARQGDALQPVLTRFLAAVRVQPLTDFAMLTGWADVVGPVREPVWRVLCPGAPRAPASRRLA